MMHNNQKNTNTHITNTDIQMLNETLEQLLRELLENKFENKVHLLQEFLEQFKYNLYTNILPINEDSNTNNQDQNEQFRLLNHQNQLYALCEEFNISGIYLSNILNNMISTWIYDNLFGTILDTLVNPDILDTLSDPDILNALLEDDSTEN